jgi:hypothetical protein
MDSSSKNLYDFIKRNKSERNLTIEKFEDFLEIKKQFSTYTENDLKKIVSFFKYKTLTKENSIYFVLKYSDQIADLNRIFSLSEQSGYKKTLKQYRDYLSNKIITNLNLTKSAKFITKIALHRIKGSNNQNEIDFINDQIADNNADNNIAISEQVLKSFSNFDGKLSSIKDIADSFFKEKPIQDDDLNVFHKMIVAFCIDLKSDQKDDFENLITNLIEKEQINSEHLSQIIDDELKRNSFIMEALNKKNDLEEKRKFIICLINNNYIKDYSHIKNIITNAQERKQILSSIKASLPVKFCRNEDLELDIFDMYEDHFSNRASNWSQNIDENQYKILFTSTDKIIEFLKENKIVGYFINKISEISKSSKNDKNDNNFIKEVSKNFLEQVKYFCNKAAGIDRGDKQEILQNIEDIIICLLGLKENHSNAVNNDLINIISIINKEFPEQKYLIKPEFLNKISSLSQGENQDLEKVKIEKNLFNLILNLLKEEKTSDLDFNRLLVSFGKRILGKMDKNYHLDKEISSLKEIQEKINYGFNLFKLEQDLGNKMDSVFNLFFEDNLSPEKLEMIKCFLYKNFKQPNNNLYDLLFNKKNDNGISLLQYAITKNENSLFLILANFIETSSFKNLVKFNSEIEKTIKNLHNSKQELDPIKLNERINFLLENRLLAIKENNIQLFTFSEEKIKQLITEIKKEIKVLKSDHSNYDESNYKDALQKLELFQLLIKNNVEVDNSLSFGLGISVDKSSCDFYILGKDEIECGSNKVSHLIINEKTKTMLVENLKKFMLGNTSIMKYINDIENKSYKVDLKGLLLLIQTESVLLNELRQPPNDPKLVMDNFITFFVKIIFSGNNVKAVGGEFGTSLFSLEKGKENNSLINGITMSRTIWNPSGNQLNDGKVNEVIKA